MIPASVDNVKGNGLFISLVGGLLVKKIWRAFLWKQKSLENIYAIYFCNSTCKICTKKIVGCAKRFSYKNVYYHSIHITEKLKIT